MSIVVAEAEGVCPLCKTGKIHKGQPLREAQYRDGRPVLVHKWCYRKLVRSHRERKVQYAPNDDCNPSIIRDVFRYAPFSGTRLLTLVAIAEESMAQQQLWVRLSVNDISDKTRIPRSSLRPILEDLEDSGWIEVKPGKPKAYRVMK